MIPALPLNGLCDLITDGTHYTPPDVGEGVPFLTVANMSADGLDFVNCARISPSEFSLVQKQNSAPRAGDVLFSKDGTVGKVHLVQDCGDFGVLSSIAILRTKKKRLDPRFLAHFLRTPQSLSAASQRKTGSAIRRIVLKDIRELMVPVFNLLDQRRVASILDQVEYLRRKQREMLEQVEILSEAIFFDMFVRNERDDWSLRRVEDIAIDMRTGPFGSQLLHSEFVDEGIAVLGIDNAVNNEFRWDQRRFITAEKYRALRRYTVRPGDVLITIMGTCGRCAIVPEDIPPAINTKHLCCITLDHTNALPAFLHASFLQHPSVLKQLGVQAKGAVMPGLNMGIIKSLELRIPPVDLQRAFVSRIEALSEIRASCREHYEQLDNLFASLQHRAFRGELTSGDVTRELELAG